MAMNNFSHSEPAALEEAQGFEEPWHSFLLKHFKHWIESKLYLKCFFVLNYLIQ